MEEAGAGLDLRLGGELVNAVRSDSRIDSAEHSRTVLLIAFHFPPLKGSSGMQRTLRFAQHLPKFGWRPIVLSIHPGAYEEVGATRGNEVPAGLEVHRAFGLNTARQLSLFGRYPKSLALPDRWMTWRWWAIPKALRIVREQNVSAVWSTFPITTAHRIGLEVSRRAGVPWIAEFRDPMWQHDWPPEPVANRVWRDFEVEIFNAADRIVFTAPSAINMYTERFPQLAAAKLSVIDNGYDEETFRNAERARTAASKAVTPPSDTSRPITLLHSGIIYRSERDPTQFFAALASLRAKGAIGPGTLQIILRASGAEANYEEDLKRLGIADIVRMVPGIDYLEALQEMLTVDALLILQASNCNAQIPAKLYEYLRAGKHILALTDPVGDTARTLDRAGAGVIARLDNAAEIECALLRFIDEVRSGSGRRPDAATVARYSREAETGELAKLLETATQKPSG